jgi:hypothetical protein
MKNKSSNKRVLFSLALTVLIVLVTSAQAGNRWDWADMTDEELAFCDEHMPEFLEIRKTQGDEAALKELDRLFLLAEEELGNNYILHRVVWYEAQAHSGKVDEEWGLTLYEYLYNRDIDLNTQPLHLNAADYIIHGNIMECCLYVGKAAKAREYILRVENSLMNDQHFDLTGESYEDRGPSTKPETGTFQSSTTTLFNRYSNQMKIRRISATFSITQRCTESTWSQKSPSAPATG